jgi:hypothetical protein
LRDEFAPALAESLSVCPAWPAEAAALASRAIHACPDALGEDFAFKLRIRGCDVI